MNLGWRVSCVFEVVGAFLRGESCQRLADGGADVVVGARLGLAQEVFKLAKTCSIGFRSGEYLGRKKRFAPAERMSARTALPLWLPRLSMTTTSSALRQGTRTFSHIGSKARAVDRAVDQPGRFDAVMAERGERGGGLPAALRHLGGEPFAAPIRAAAIAERVVTLTLMDPPGEATHWTGATMAKAVGISVSSVQRIWRADGLQSHRVRQFSCPRTRSLPPICATSSGSTLIRPPTPSCFRSTRKAKSRRSTAPSRVCQ